MSELSRQGMAKANLAAIAAKSAAGDGYSHADMVRAGVQAYVSESVDPEVKILRDKLALIDVTVALWEAGAVEMQMGARTAGVGTHAYVVLSHRASANRAHAEQIRDILKGE